MDVEIDDETHFLHPELSAGSAGQALALSIHDLAAWCRQFSPVVGVEDAEPPESVFLDITGLEHLFGSEASLAETIADELSRRRFDARVAVADTLGAGLGRNTRGAEGGQAHFSAVRCSRNARQNWPKMNQSPAYSSFRLHPSSFILVPPGQVAAALRPLPVAALRLPDEVLALVQQLGIFQIGQLKRLPRAELSARFGPRVPADGTRPPAGWPSRSRPIGRRLGFGPSAVWNIHHAPRRDRNGLPIAHRAAGLRTARNSGGGALQLVGRLRSEDGATVEITVGLFQPATTAAHSAPLVQLQLDRLQLPGPISAVCVEATVVAAQERRQQELLGDTQQRNAQNAGRTDRPAEQPVGGVRGVASPAVGRRPTRIGLPLRPAGRPSGASSPAAALGQVAAAPFTPVFPGRCH